MHKGQKFFCLPLFSFYGTMLILENFSEKAGFYAMNMAEVFLVGVGLSMDAFAVAICKGLSMRKFSGRYACTVAGFFGAFQALMPLLGWALGSRFSLYIRRYDHWIAFLLLLFIGGNMIRESREKSDDAPAETVRTDYKELLILAVATSIDALAVGITFAFLDVSVLPAVSLIGVTTFLISLGGVAVGNCFGSRFKSSAEVLGGVILIAIGCKILWEHLSSV